MTMAKVRTRARAMYGPSLVGLIAIVLGLELELELKLELWLGQKLGLELS